MNSLRINKLAVTYPSGNTTAMVFDDLRSLNRKKLNDSILKWWQNKYPDKPPIEQCCFVTKARNPGAIGRVEMFGGEFCGNAARSVVWLLTNKKNGKGLIEVSGYDQPLKYQVEDGSVTLQMPKATVREIPEGIAVEFDGITQVVTSSSLTRPLLKKLISSSDWNQLPAVGVTNYDPNTKQARFSVWVKNVDTIFNETACGSGTAAIGIVEALKTKTNQKLEVIQPSGELITVSPMSKINKTEISGVVMTLYLGEVELI